MSFTQKIMSIKAIKIGNFTVDSKKIFRFLTEENQQTDALKMGIQPFVLQTHNELILIDAGIDSCENSSQLLMQALENNNINPSSITKIVLSHLHKDHLEGLAYFENNRWHTYFPQATIFVQQREYDFAIGQTTYAYNQSLLHDLKSWPNIVWLTEDKGQIVEELRFEVTGGHSPFHQVFWIHTSDGNFFYGGDNLPTQKYLQTSIAFKTDFDGKKARSLRKFWKDIWKNENYQLLLYHDLYNTIVRGE